MDDSGFQRERSPAALPPIVQPTTARCSQCGYDLSGTAVGGNCPECGMNIMISLRAEALPTSGKAIAALVLGICSIVLGCASYGVISIACSPLALIFSHQAFKDVAARRAGGGSRGMAIAGLVTGLVGGVFALFALLFIAAMLVGLFAPIAFSLISYSASASA